jgi:hypothetical protein
MKASELKIGNTFSKQGLKYTVVKITTEEYLNGTKSLMVECIMNNIKFNPKNLVDSTFHFKVDTKIK